MQRFFQAGEKEFDSSAVEDSAIMPKSSPRDLGSVQESVAKAIAALTFNHNLPPSYVQCAAKCLGFGSSAIQSAALGQSWSLLGGTS